MISGTTKFAIGAVPQREGCTYVCTLPAPACALRDVGGLIEAELQRGDFCYIIPDTGRMIVTPHRINQANN